MQGVTALDAAGNPVRVIDVIGGKRIDVVVGRINCGHEEYFYDHLPGILGKFVSACGGIAFLHEQGEQHGDINLDHLMREYTTGLYRWIDFDYAYEAHANPWRLDLSGLGRILTCLVGKLLFCRGNLAELGVSPKVAESLEPEDFACVHKNEIVNLRKLFPYIPTHLNNVLMHFSRGAEVFYDSVPEFLDDVRESVSNL